MSKFVYISKKIVSDRFDISSIDISQFSIKGLSVTYFYPEKMLTLIIPINDETIANTFSKISPKEDDPQDIIRLDADRDIIPEADTFLNIIDIIVDRCTK